MTGTTKNDNSTRSKNVADDFTGALERSVLNSLDHTNDGDSIGDMLTNGR